MHISATHDLTEAGRGIRTAVFVVEKNYRPEFDGWDDDPRTTHLLAFDGERPVGTCRLYLDPDHPDQPGRYVIARLAVLPDMQGRGFGSALLARAEAIVADEGGRITAVHVEDRNFAFYERYGYAATDEMYDGGTHGWMTKSLERHAG